MTCDRQTDRQPHLFFFRDTLPTVEGTTENWIGSPGWTQFGSAKPHRSIQDFTYSIALCGAYGATMHDIYMRYGSTNYGRVEHILMHFHMGYIILRVKSHHR